MTYEELNGFDHADKVPNFCVDANNPLVFRVGGKGIVNIENPDAKGLCCVCTRETLWFEISFLAAMCSPRCNEIMWGNYFDADIAAGPIHV